MKQKTNNKKASALVVTLTVLFILIIISLGIMGVSVMERKSSGKSAQSDKAFQVADSGVEIFRTEKKANPNNAISASSAFFCSGGTITGSAAGGSYAATLYLDSAGMTVANCGDKFADIQQIKSVGTYSGASRIVKVAVAAGCPCIRQVCFDTPFNGQCDIGGSFLVADDTKFYQLRLDFNGLEGDITGGTAEDEFRVATLPSKTINTTNNVIKFLGTTGPTGSVCNYLIRDGRLRKNCNNTGWQYTPSPTRIWSLWELSY